LQKKKKSSRKLLKHDRYGSKIRRAWGRKGDRPNTSEERKNYRLQGGKKGEVTQKNRRNHRVHSCRDEKNDGKNEKEEKTWK